MTDIVSAFMNEYEALRAAQGEAASEAVSAEVTQVETYEAFLAAETRRMELVGRVHALRLVAAHYVFTSGPAAATQGLADRIAKLEGEVRDVAAQSQSRLSNLTLATAELERTRAIHARARAATEAVGAYKIAA